MKQRNLLIIAIAVMFGLSGIILSCQKRDSQSNNPSDILSQATLQAAKDWHALSVSGQNKGDVSTLGLGNSKKILYPKWESAKYLTLSSGERLIYVDAPGYDLGTNTINFARAFLFSINNDMITGGQIIEVYSKTNDLKDLSAIIENYKNPSISNFDGSIISYDVNYGFQGSKVFVNGKLNKGTAHIEVKSQVKPGTEVLGNRLAGTKILAEGQECTYWYYDIFLDDDLIDSIYLYSTGNCSGGGGGGGGSGGSGSTSPPPGGGNTQTTNQLPPFPADPCAQKAILYSEASNTINAANTAQINTSTTSTGNEYGTEQNLYSVQTDTYRNMGVRTDNSPNSFAPTFSWNNLTGFTIGVNHGHPAGTAPSPADVVWGAGNLNSSQFSTNPQFPGGGYADIDFYKTHYSLTVTTSSGNYIMTVKDWNTLSSDYTFYQTHQDAVNLQFQITAQDAGGNADFALLSMYGNAVNLFKAPAGTNNYQPISVNSTNNGTATNPCPPTI